jgi:hypothetical protein
LDYGEENGDKTSVLSVLEAVTLVCGQKTGTTQKRSNYFLEPKKEIKG